MDILSSLFNVVACPVCHSTSLMQQQTKKQGLAFKMKLTCLDMKKRSQNPETLRLMVEFIIQCDVQERVMED